MMGWSQRKRTALALLTSEEGAEGWILPELPFHEDRQEWLSWGFEVMGLTGEAIARARQAEAELEDTKKKLKQAEQENRTLKGITAHEENRALATANQRLTQRNKDLAEADRRTRAEMTLLQKELEEERKRLTQEREDITRERDLAMAGPRRVCDEMARLVRELRRLPGMGTIPDPGLRGRDREAADGIRGALEGGRPPPSVVPTPATGVPDDRCLLEID